MHAIPLPRPQLDDGFEVQTRHMAANHAEDGLPVRPARIPRDGLAMQPEGLRGEPEELHQHRDLLGNLPLHRGEHHGPARGGGAKILQ
ncbi:unnamed protein product [Phytomonas sp. EM1]|nr:unnamed protein product [Phytomonas sp. EM1]|eukprot:CCW65688.1 unnamed protein product [Phytomonas sp. isolate EM1]